MKYSAKHCSWCFMLRRDKVDEFYQPQFTDEGADTQRCQETCLVP